jgi:predicted neuraminidase
MDGGRTWARSPVPLDHSQLKGKGVIQPTLWETSPNLVHMLLRSTEGRVYRSDSADGGHTWRPAYALDVPNNNSGLDAAMTNGKLLLVHNPVSGDWAARTPLVLSCSADNGYSFSPLMVLDNDLMDLKAEFSYPAIVTMDDDIYITYTYRRQSIAYCHLKMSRDNEHERKLNP